MLNIIKSVLLSSAVFSMVSFNVSAGVQVGQAELLAVACFSCHGRNGIGAKRIPKLSKLSKNDISESLHGFKSGEERSTIMGRHAEAYTDEEITLLAEYIVSLKNK